MQPSLPTTSAFIKAENSRGCIYIHLSSASTRQSLIVGATSQRPSTPPFNGIGSIVVAISYTMSSPIKLDQLEVPCRQSCYKPQHCILQEALDRSMVLSVVGAWWWTNDLRVCCTARKCFQIVKASGWDLFSSGLRYVWFEDDRQLCGGCQFLTLSIWDDISSQARESCVLKTVDGVGQCIHTLNIELP